MDIPTQKYQKLKIDEGVPHPSKPRPLRGASPVIRGQKLKNELRTDLSWERPILQGFSTENYKKKLFPPHFRSFWHPCVPGYQPEIRL